jgi:hypothetical protein
VVVFASEALSHTLGLIATFGGIGVIVNGLVVYIVVQVLAEHAANQQRRTRRGA